MNSTCICTVFKMKSWNFTGTSATLWDRSWKGWRFYHLPTGVRNKGLITQKTWIQRAFAQFSRWRVETSQERQWLLRIGRGRVDVSTVPPEGSEIRVNYPKKREFDVFSHSFQDEKLKLHRNVEVISPWQVVEGLTFLPFPHRGQK